jgi:hypothetical protein
VQGLNVLDGTSALYALEGCMSVQIHRENDGRLFYQCERMA